jgi:hypothetical protein
MDEDVPILIPGKKLHLFLLTLEKKNFVFLKVIMMNDFFLKFKFNILNNNTNNIKAVNPDHIDIIPYQQQSRGYKSGGFIVTNANCSSTGLVVALKPLADAFGIEKCLVVTLQVIYRYIVINIFFCGLFI